MAQITHVRSVNIGDNNANCNNTIGSHNNTTNIYNSNEDAKIMSWLSPLEPGNRHNDVRKERFEGVENWLLETNQFLEWRWGEGGEDKAVLFCSGKPGAGKTYLSSVVIDSLCDQARNEDIAVAWLYCDHNARAEQTVINMMGAILKKMVGSKIPEDIRRAFEEKRRTLLPELMQILRIAIASLPQVFICIDALDEYLPEDLPELLESLRDIVRWSPGTRIFLTGRPYVDKYIQECFATAVEIPIGPKTDDIRNYLNMKLDKADKLLKMEEDFREEIVRTILNRMSDIFLLPSLIINAILREKTIFLRRRKLREMAQGSGLSDAYTATLTQLEPQEGSRQGLGQKALMWVLCSRRPLRVEELCHALAVEIGSEDPNPENVPTQQTLLESCLGLLTVEASSSTVRLVHLTLQEYLTSDPTRLHNDPTLLHSGPTPLHSSHSTIAEVCLTYLNFGSVMALSPTLGSAPSAMPLLEYASLYWGEHTRIGMTENVKTLALRLLDRFDEHLSAQLLLLQHSKLRRWSGYYRLEGGPTGFTGLHGVSFLGIVEIVAPVLEMNKWDINVADCTGTTALNWAIQRGQEEIVRVLLKQKDINPDQADECGWTPLSWAAKEGHEGIVEILLKRNDVNPDKADKYDRTPLWWGAEGGREGIVKILLERKDINPDQADEYGRTPLSQAAKGGHEGVVSILLERNDVNPDQGDQDGRTPLSWAVEEGHKGIVEILLERQDVNPDQADTEYGQTPPSLAAGGGHEGIVKMILEREDANPNQGLTADGQTPLSWAITNGRLEIVKLLLEREDIDPNQADLECGRTPLFLAAASGHEEVVKMLLERKETDPNQADLEHGWTPLVPAVMSGHDGVVKTLLERKDVNLDQAFTADIGYDQTPLLWATENGYEAIVKMLLERIDAV